LNERRCEINYVACMPTAAEDREKKAFGRRLRKARERQWKSAESFAKHLRLDPHRYRHYERGDSYPPPPVLQTICAHLGVTQAALLGLQGTTDQTDANPVSDATTAH
jgi:transcriptional regulator with XRE-family HTH domain